MIIKTRLVVVKQNPPLAILKNSKSSNQNHYQPFKKKNKGFIQLNPPQLTQHVDSQVVVVNKTNPFTFGDLNRQFTPLPDTLHNTMLQLLENKFITLSPIKFLYPTKPLPPNYISNSYFHYH
jgi:hypothetical protein